MEPHSITLRDATLDDAAFLFALRTDPDVVANSNRAAPPNLEDHTGWLRKALANNWVRLFIVEDEGPRILPIGQCRLDVSYDGVTAEVSIALIRAARGRSRREAPPVGLEAYGECLIWTGQAMKNGYAQIKVEGRLEYVHRLAFVQAHGPIPDDRPFVCHRCDRPLCIASRHIYAGTAADNTRDCWERNRGFVAATGRYQCESM